MSTFGDALKILKDGDKAARVGWNGKGMWLRIVPEMLEGTTGRRLLPYIQMRTVDDDLVPWLASQTDLLTEDWIKVHPERKSTPI
jgi:hypothetical protein